MDRGDGESFAYLLRLIAWMVRKPSQSQRSKITLVLSGGQGMGKSFVMDKIGSLIGSSYRRISGSTGKDFMEDSYCIGWNVSDHPIDRGTLDTNHHWILTTDRMGQLPIRLGDRRFVYFEFLYLDLVYSKEQIEEEWIRGGREAFLHLLMETNISGFDPSRVPLESFRSIWKEKQYQMDKCEGWLFDRLVRGKIFDFGDPWPSKVDLDNLYSSYLSYVNGDDQILSGRQLWHILEYRLIPPLSSEEEWKTERSIAHLKLCREFFAERVAFVPYEVLFHCESSKATRE